MTDWQTCPQGHGTIIHKRGQEYYIPTSQETSENFCPICNVLYSPDEMIIERDY